MPARVDSIAASARDALQQVAEPARYHGSAAVYVFAGQDSGQPAGADPGRASSLRLLSRQIKAAVAGLCGAGGAAATATATLAIAASNAAGTSPFSAYSVAAGSDAAGAASLQVADR